MMRASSLSSVRSVGVDRMFAAACVSSARARKARFVICAEEPGRLIVPRMTPRLSPVPDAQRVDRHVDDVRCRCRARRSWCRRSPCVSVELSRPRQRLPLDAELRGLVGGDLDDQRLDVNLRAAHVELLDDRAQVVVDRLGRHDDQRVVRRCRPERSRRSALNAFAPAGGENGERGSPRRPWAAACAAAAPCPPPRTSPAAPAKRWRDDGAPAVAAGQQRAQRLRNARRVGVLQVDDEQVAAGASRRVELLDQLPHARRARRVLAAHQHAVAARIGDQRHALRWHPRPRRRAPARRSSSRFTSVTMSSADACRSGTSIGSAAGGWSSDAMMRSMRRRLSA